MYRIVLDRNLCSGFGACVDAAPDDFALDSAGVATAAAETADGAALAAAAACPMGAIAVFDPSTGEQLA